MNLDLLIEEIKNEHKEFDFDDPSSIVNHCSYFGICVMQKLKDKGFNSSTLLLKIKTKDLPEGYILKRDSSDYCNHNVVLFDNNIIDLTRMQFGTLISDDITDKNIYLKDWSLIKETKSINLNLKTKIYSKTKIKR